MRIFILASCAPSRQMTDARREFAYQIHGPTLGLRQVRQHKGAPTRAVAFKRKSRRRTT